MDQALTCPSCGENITLTESLAKPLLENLRSEYETRLKSERKKMLSQSQEIEKARAQLENERSLLDQELQKRLDKEKQVLSKEIQKQIEAKLAQDIAKGRDEIQHLKSILSDRDKKLQSAQKAELDFMKKQQELEDKMREQELEVEKKVQNRSKEIMKTAQAKAQESLQLHITQRDEKIASMTRQIEELKRKAEQGSQQLQGEAQEILLEEWLMGAFPLDNISPVEKGRRGADILQTITLPSGGLAGTILWETKNTKNFQKPWLAKLREDQRASKADIAILVSSILPDDMKGFGMKDDIWICTPKEAIALALSLRNGLVELAKSRLAIAGQESKKDAVYRYLTGSGFRQRVEAIMENFSAMQTDLQKERIAMERIWAKREKQILNILGATSGLYGDLQGIAGEDVETINALEISGLLEE